jgi:hypothetical protein
MNLLLGRREVVVVQGRRRARAAEEGGAPAWHMASGNHRGTGESRHLAEEPKTWVRHDQRRDMLEVEVEEVVVLATWQAEQAEQVRKVMEAKTAGDLAMAARVMAEKRSARIFEPPWRDISCSWCVGCSHVRAL